MKHTIGNARFFFLLPGTCYLAEFFVWHSFPQSHGLNAVLGGLWTMGQAGILVILYHLYNNAIANGNRWRTAGVMIAAAGVISYSINYFFGYWMNMNTKMFLPVGALLSAIGMTITGIQVLVAKRWFGLKRFFPMFVGLYPFIVMFPLLIVTGHPDINAIMGWGIPWLMLGLAMVLSTQHSKNHVWNFNGNQDKMPSRVNNRHDMVKER